ncbi:MAG: hypothetical protein WCJ30_15520, partial [Deltaproteobacteria bacterium]
MLDDANHVVGACSGGPCVLSMPPGTYQVAVRDARWNYTRRRLVVPVTGTAVSSLRPRTRPATIALAVGGGASVGAGFVLLIFAWTNAMSQYSWTTTLGGRS